MVIEIIVSIGKFGPNDQTFFSGEKIIKEKYIFIKLLLISLLIIYSKTLETRLFNFFYIVIFKSK